MAQTLFNYYQPRWYMGIYIKRRGNDEYVYLLYGKKQLYLGRLDDPASINQAKLLKGVTMLDKGMDSELEQYVESIIEHTKFMDGKNSNSYLNKRRKNMNNIISKLKHRSKLIH